ncbi:MAG: hypothetical protein KZY55_00785 [Paeniclostridium sp.]|nr:hypothetical protein [Paeniclostridium sp.]MBW4862434.1 hypothetical protein [Paeniclostridium sp.]MBW4872576.1 hypothetical protein [Paeniclostridium sp.]
MLKRFMTMKKFRESYYIVPKSLETVSLSEFGGNNINLKKLGIILEKLDMFIVEDCKLTELVLKTGYICYADNTKKLNQKQIEEIKKDKGSVREKAKKYNVSVGTISKINNDKY